MSFRIPMRVQKRHVILSAAKDLGAIRRSLAANSIGISRYFAGLSVAEVAGGIGGAGCAGATGSLTDASHVPCILRMVRVTAMPPLSGKFTTTMLPKLPSASRRVAISAVMPSRQVYLVCCRVASVRLSESQHLLDSSSGSSALAALSRPTLPRG